MGKYIEKGKGYVMVRNPLHPRARQNGYVLEHLLVMEEVIGRPVKRGEHVHHKNKIRSDNRPENLQLLTPHAHLSLHGIKYFGCRIEDCQMKNYGKGLCRLHYKREYRARNRDKLNTAQREWREKNIERLRPQLAQYAREWRKRKAHIDS